MAELGATAVTQAADGYGSPGPGGSTGDGERTWDPGLSVQVLESQLWEVNTLSSPISQPGILTLCIHRFLL